MQVQTCGALNQINELIAINIRLLGNDLDTILCRTGKLNGIGIRRIQSDEDAIDPILPLGFETERKRIVREDITVNPKEGTNPSIATKLRKNDVGDVIHGSFPLSGTRVANSLEEVKTFSDHLRFAFISQNIEATGIPILNGNKHIPKQVTLNGDGPLANGDLDAITIGSEVLHEGVDVLHALTLSERFLEVKDYSIAC